MQWVKVQCKVISAKSVSYSLFDLANKYLGGKNLSKPAKIKVKNLYETVYILPI